MLDSSPTKVCRNCFVAWIRMSWSERMGLRITGPRNVRGKFTVLFRDRFCWRPDWGESFHPSEIGGPWITFSFPLPCYIRFLIRWSEQLRWTECCSWMSISLRDSNRVSLFLLIAGSGERIQRRPIATDPMLQRITGYHSCGREIWTTIWFPARFGWDNPLKSWRNINKHGMRDKKRCRSHRIIKITRNKLHKSGTRDLTHAADFPNIPWTWPRWRQSKGQSIEGRRGNNGNLDTHWWQRKWIDMIAMKSDGLWHDTTHRKIRF
jgi:hypothetical protein